MAGRETKYRIQVVGGAEGKKEFELVGKSAEDVFKKIKKASEQPAAGLKGINAASREVQGAMQDLGGRAGALGRILGALGPVGLAAGAGVGAFVYAVSSGIRTFAEAERAQLRLQGVIKASGGIAGVTAAQIADLSEEFERSSFFSKEQYQQAAASLATFGSVAGTTFTRTLSLATDLAEVFGGDLQSAATTLGKALEDPATGLTSLRRAGIVFSESQKELIKDLVESGKQMEAQKVILDALEKKLGGSASGAHGGVAGSLDNVGKAFGDLSEAIGSFFANSSVITGFFEGMINLTDAAAEALNRYSDNWNKLSVQSLRQEGLGLKGQIEEMRQRRADVERLAQTPDLRGTAERAKNTLKNIDADLEKLYAKKLELDKILAGKGTPASATPTPPAGGTGGGSGKQKADELRGYIKDLEKELELSKLSTSARKQEEAVMRAQNIALKEHKTLSEQDAKHIRETVAEMEKLEQAQRASEEAAKLLNEPFRRAIENIQDAGADMLYQWKFNTDGMVDIARRAAAEIAAAWIFRPVIPGALNFVGIGGGAGGAGGSVGGGVTGGGGGGLSGLGSLGSVFSGGGNLGQFFNNTVFSTTGNYQLAAQAYKIGANFTPGASLAGLGGSLLSSAIFGGGTGNTIGSTIGGIAGTAIGGPIGAFVGSFLGGALGGLFGGKPSSRLQAGEFDLQSGKVTSTSGLTGAKFSQENADARDAILAFAGQVADVLSAGTGKRPSGNLIATVSDRYGITIQLNDNAQRAFGSGNDALRYLTEAISGTVSGTPASLMTAISKIDFTKTEQALADLQFALNFDKLGDTVEQITEAEAALKALQDQFAALRDTAARLGLSLDKVNAAEQQQVQKFLDDYNRSIDLQLLGKISDGALNLVAETERYQAQLKEAQKIGADIARVEALHQANLLEIQNQQLGQSDELASRFRNVSSALAKTIDEFTFGKFSGQSPVGNLDTLRARLVETGNRAKIGDIAAAEGLTDLISQFVALSGSVNGFNTSYEADRALAEQYARDAKSLADRQFDVQQDIASGIREQIQVLTAGFSTITDALANYGALTGIPHFASGGVASGLAVVGENGAELAHFSSPTRIYDAATTRQLLSPANDNALSSELRAIRVGIEALLRVNVASGDGQAASMAAMRAALDSIDRKARLAAAG